MMGRKIRQNPITHLALGLVVSLVLTGCNVQQEAVRVDQTLSEPVIDEALTRDDFAFPSQPPSLVRGREVFNNNCAQCHAAGYWQQSGVQQNLAFTTPIDTFLLLTRGQAPQEKHPSEERLQLLPDEHPAFRDTLSRDDRWAVIFYARYLAGAADIEAPSPDSPDVAAIFGGNCAVCHGKRGFADGPLHIGKTGNHEVHDARVFHNLLPAPANFHQYSRMYNRTDAQIMKYICEGIYPSAMPAWYGDVHMDKDTGEVVYVFDNALISSLVRHVRTFAYNNDLNVDPAEVPRGLNVIDPCQSTYTNQPWTPEMRRTGLTQERLWTAEDQQAAWNTEEQQGGDTR